MDGGNNKLEKLKQLEIQVNQREVLEKLVTQFKVKETWWREGIQNSKGAFASRVDITFAYDEPTKTLEMAIEDDGEGMNDRDREAFLLKLFASSKEFDPERPGMFGIGVVSAFAYKPEEFIVESSKEGHHWKIVVDGKDYSMRLFDNNPRQGTRVTLRKRVKSAEVAKEMESAALAAVIQDCSQMEFPIYFQGKQVNRPFEFERRSCQITRKDDLAEVVLGITASPTTRFYNHRILLKDSAQYFFWTLKFAERYGVSALINSKYLSFNLSRNDIIMDKTYEKIIEKAASYLDDLAIEAFRNLGELVPEDGVEDLSNEEAIRAGVLWSFVLAYIEQRIEQGKEKERGARFRRVKRGKLARKKNDAAYLPREMRETPIFATWDDTAMHHSGKLSLDEVLAFARKNEKALTAYRDSKVLATLSEQGIPVLRKGNYALEPAQAEHAGKYKPVRGYIDFPSKFLEKFCPSADVESLYYMPMVMQDKELTRQESEFLRMARAELKGSALAKEYDEVVFGDFSQEWGDDALRPFMLLADSVSNRSYGRKPLFSDEEKRTYMKRFKGRRTMVLNRSSDYLQRLVELSTTPKRDFAVYFLFQALAIPATYYSESEVHLELYRQFIGRLK